MRKHTPFMLMILDGFGINPDTHGNAVAMADTPFIDHLMQTCPSTQLIPCGPAVGLPEGIMGNSEVGHMNLGAGRVVFQDLVRIDRAIADGSFFDNPSLLAAMDAASQTGHALHLIGLVSDGGVHSQLAHLIALLEMARRQRLPQVYIHAIMDGRDTPPDSGAGFIQQLQQVIQDKQLGAIASICGRFYAMDRDKRWQRVERAYQLYTQGLGAAETDPHVAMMNAYQRGETDEFVKPIIMVDPSGRPLTRMIDGDSVIFFNFRADRAREITQSLTDPNFTDFSRPVFPNLNQLITMTQYDENVPLVNAFPPEHLDNILGEIISHHHLPQLRIAETEKYAHVTYFFNGGEEISFTGEDRCLIPSPRDVETYDQKPQMSATEVTDTVIKKIESEQYALIVLNFANMDMVGHTGVLDAAIRACEFLDGCVNRVVSAIQSKGGRVLITADHGNAEQMLDSHGHPHTAHTLNPVPLILVDDSNRQVTLKPGVLGDVAPTILQLMEIAQPPQMTGRSLIVSSS